jgi:hypothetical protein
MIKYTFLATTRSAARRSSTHRRWATRAFSIPQLLAYSVASALLVVVANATLLSSLRSNNNMEMYQRAEERWSRISALIQAEVREAHMIRYNTFISCSGAASGGTFVNWDFTLYIPILQSIDGGGGDATIRWGNVGSGSSAEIRRCGVGYLADGTFSENNTLSTVGLRTQMLITNAAKHSFTYTINIYTPSNQLIFSRSAIASVGVVCDSDLDFPACDPQD